MKISFAGLACCVGLAVLLSTGCATTFQGQSRYVSYSPDGKVKSVKQSALLSGEKVQSTYDDEYVYDDKGNMIKHKQTDYFESSDPTKPQFVVWETEYRVVSGTPLPIKVSANGVPYIELEYELLSTGAKGKITQGISNRTFTQNIQEFTDSTTLYWNISLGEFPVDFESDGKFIVTKSSYNYYAGFYDQRVLTLGYDNIALKKYSYSHEKLAEGVSKSYSGGLDGLQARNVANEYKGSSFSFDYNWQVINDKICQTKAVFSQVFKGRSLYFVADVEYNKAGQRTKETWNVAASKDEFAKKATTVFVQNLDY